MFSALIQIVDLWTARSIGKKSQGHTFRCRGDEQKNYMINIIGTVIDYINNETYNIT